MEKSAGQAVASKLDFSVRDAPHVGEGAVNGEASATQAIDGKEGHLDDAALWSGGQQRLQRGKAREKRHRTKDEHGKKRTRVRKTPPTPLRGKAEGRTKPGLGEKLKRGRDRAAASPPLLLRASARTKAAAPACRQSGSGVQLPARKASTSAAGRTSENAAALAALSVK